MKDYDKDHDLTCEHGFKCCGVCHDKSGAEWPNINAGSRPDGLFIFHLEWHPANEEPASEGPICSTTLAMGSMLPSVYFRTTEGRTVSYSSVESL